MGVSVDVLVGTLVAVGVPGPVVGVLVAVKIGRGVNVGVGVKVGKGVFVGTGVPVGVTVGDGVKVDVDVGVLVGSGVSVGVLVLVGVLLGVLVTVLVGVGPVTVKGSSATRQESPEQGFKRAKRAESWASRAGTAVAAKLFNS